MPEYWFPAKRYGWGWGMPRTWQGWLVLAAVFVAALAGVVIFPPEERITAYVVYNLAIVAAAIAICYAKGEPPSWRWGDK
jgi:lipoprotein signal peptidase